MLTTRAALEEKRKEGHITPFGQNLRMDVTELDQGGQGWQSVRLTYFLTDNFKAEMVARDENFAQGFEMVGRVRTSWTEEQNEWREKCTDKVKLDEEIL